MQQNLQQTHYLINKYVKIKLENDNNNFLQAVQTKKRCSICTTYFLQAVQTKKTVVQYALFFDDNNLPTCMCKKHLLRP